jgi:excisionase family DNA binding protein
LAKNYLTAEEIAEELSVSIDTVRAWINHPDVKQRLPAYKMGRQYRIKKEDFQKYMQERYNVPKEGEEQ